MNPKTPIELMMTQLILEAMTEKELRITMMARKNDTFSSYVVLDDVSVFEAAELDAIAFLTDIRDNALDLK